MTEPQDSEESALAVAFSAGSEAEAAIVAGILEEGDVPVMVQDISMPSEGGIIALGQSRWADLLVRASQLNEAQALIAAAQTTPTAPDIETS